MPMIGENIRLAGSALQRVSDTALLDAEILMRHTLSAEPAWLIAHARDNLGTNDQEVFDDLLARRLAGHPIAYLVGSREFFSMDICVNPDVLIPRPDTETLVEIALEHLPLGNDDRVVDLGTGSGAIALAIARERPRCQITATDKSPTALVVALENAARLKLTSIEFLPGNWYAPLADRKFDLIVSNPPYIPVQDKHLELGDVRFEPRGALCGGEDGLVDIRIIIAGAGEHLQQNGKILVEHGFDQGEAVRAEFRKRGFTAIETYPDMSGNPRVTLGLL